jgi:ankyrin repeat protein
MNNKRPITLTVCWIVAVVLGLSVQSFANNESETIIKAEQHFQKANELHILADYDAAIAEYQTVISLSPNSKIAQNAQYWIGQLYFDKRQFDAALTTFQELINEFPDSMVVSTTKTMIERVQQAKKNKALFEAVKKADVEQVKLLIAEGADVDSKWGDLYNEKWPDAENENTRENLSLLRKKWRDERPPLYYAVDGGKLEVVRLLVEAGADINAGSWAALSKAVEENNTTIAEYLIDQGATVNVDIIPNWGFLQETAITDNSLEMAKLLIDRGIEINSRVYPVLTSSIGEDRMDLCELLIQRGVDINTIDKWGYTALRAAIRKDDLKYMNLLIANGADVDIKHPEGETPLHFAARGGRPDAVKLLLEAGANINAKDDRGQTALHRAAELADGDTVELLLAKGAKIDAKDKQGHTPLYVAINHDYRVAELLMNKGADSGIRIETGQTLLALAQQRKQAESTVPDMVFDGDPNSLFGLTVVSGDVDGDGYDDILVGAHKYNNLRGRVYLYYGGPNMDNTADLILEGQNEGDWFGNGVVCGDIDNDGHADIVIGAGKYSEKRGRAYLYWGSDRKSMDANPDKIFNGEAEEGAHFGAGYPAVYDIDNDGYDDIILGACASWAPGDGMGRAYLYYGNTKALMDTSHDHVFTGEKPKGAFGYSISCGDVDNDGYGDIVIGAGVPGEKRGRAYLYYGGSKSIMDAKADAIFEVDSKVWPGQRVVCVDQNRDGYDDVVIGARGYNNTQGRAYLFHGNSKRSLDTDPDMILDGEVGGSYFGAQVACGDIDGDHVNDIVIGARRFGQQIGRVYVYWGKELAGSNPKPNRIFTGEHPNDEFGYGLACGDVNNDGFDDLVIGAYGYKDKAGAQQGRVYLYYGGPKNK